MTTAKELISILTDINNHPLPNSYTLMKLIRDNLIEELLLSKKLANEIASSISITIPHEATDDEILLIATQVTIFINTIMTQMLADKFSMEAIVLVLSNQIQWDDD